MTGLRLLGQPVGSSTFAHKFFLKKFRDTRPRLEAKKLLKAVPDHQMALRLFYMRTMHKLPHLLGSDIQAERWYGWLGPLASGIDEMASCFLDSSPNENPFP